jgi:ParB/Sulfiredoxin domain
MAAAAHSALHDHRRSGIQQRAAGTSQDVVADYAEEMRNGAAFPPIDVFATEDGILYLADGVHRLLADQSAHPDAEDIECRVHPGTRDDAQLYACGANAQHGLQRSRSDKMKAVTTALCNERSSGWSDREIARQCRVSHVFVATVRRTHLETRPDAGPPDDGASASADPSATAAAGGGAPDRRRTVRRGGKGYRMNTARIGRGRSTPGRRKKVAPKPKLDSLAWSEANAVERARFIEAVGRRSLEDALDASQPPDEVARLELTFRRFERAVQTASEPARQTFLEQCRDKIMALAQAAEPPVGDEAVPAALARANA